MEKYPELISLIIKKDILFNTQYQLSRKNRSKKIDTIKYVTNILAL